MNKHIYTGISHGTLGELFQGPCIRDDQLQIAIVSLPIPKYSWVHFSSHIASDITVDMKAKSKSLKAVFKYLAHYDKALPEGQWSFSSELEQGKGMASSTADIIATIRCLDAIFHQLSSPDLITQFLRDIERSDSVFLDTHALYLSSKQEIVCHLGKAQFFSCYIDEGEAIDTENLANQLLDHYQQELPAYLANLNHTINAFLDNNLKAIGRCATESARLSQGIVPKHHFKTLLENQTRFNADGIVIAHTGSLLGYLFTEKPNTTMMGELSSFFLSLGHQCRFVRTGVV